MAQSSISVSQLKCAVLDPAWRQEYRAGNKPSTMSFAPAGQLQVFGTKFHSEADKIVAWLLSQPKSAWDALTLDGDEFWQFVHDTFVGDFLESTANEGKVEEAMGFAERMRTFCNRIVFLRQRAKNFETWQDVFFGNELSVNKAMLQTGDFSVSLTGRVDAVRPQIGIQASPTPACDHRSQAGVGEAWMPICGRGGILFARISGGKNKSR